MLKGDVFSSSIHVCFQHGFEVFEEVPYVTLLSFSTGRSTHGETPRDLPYSMSCMGDGVLTTARDMLDGVGSTG